MYRQADEIIWLYCLEGDRKAFEVLYRRHYSVLCAYGKFYSSDNDMIENCVQDFFVKLISNHSNLSATPSVRSYLLKGFRYTLYNELKSRERHNELITGLSDDVLDVRDDDSSEAEDISSRNSLIRSYIKKLPSRQQEILYLFHVAELGHDEIASLLNINYQSSKNLLFRAIVNLRNMLKNNLG